MLATKACDKPGVLPGRHASIATATEEEITGVFSGKLDARVDRLASLLSYFEPDGPSGLRLTDRRAIKAASVWCNVLDPEANEITAPELAIDRKIKHGEVACSPLDLQL